MASRRTTMGPSTLKTSTENKSSKSATSKDDGALVKKKSKASGTIVKSRYLQTVEKTGSLSKSNSANESVVLPPRPSSPKPVFAKPRPSSPKPGFAKPRPSSPKPGFAKPRPSSPKPGCSNPKVGTPPRRSMAPLAFPTPILNLESSFVSASMLQSTFTEGGHHRPDYDLSVIKENPVIQNVLETEKNPENDKDDIEQNTFLLAYLTAKMGHNNAKLRAEMDARLREEMEEDDRLRQEVQEMKRQYLQTEKGRILNELLDLQSAALEPVVAAAKLFTEDYKSFASAIDTTRHELPIKNIHIEGDRMEFLDKAEACLKDSETILMDCTHGDQEINTNCVTCLREMKKASKDISHELSAGFSGLLELSVLVSRHAIHSQQALEEEHLGPDRIQELHGSSQGPTSPTVVY